MAEPESFRLRLTRPGLYSWLWDVSYATGTTIGVPTPFYNTVHDYYGCCLMRVAKIQGGRPEDVYLNLFPLGPIPHIGFLRTGDTGMVPRP